MNDYWKIEYDQRQYKLMADFVEKFDNGLIGIDCLIAQLKALVSSLELPNISWNDEFISEWGTLEILHALELERLETIEMGKTCYESHKDIMVQALRNIHHLLLIARNTNIESGTHNHVAHR